MLKKDATKNGEEALLEVYRKLRPGEPPTIESAVKHLVPLLFDERRYDLSRVGRYKYNKKLAIGNRLVGQILAEPVVNELTGEVIAAAGQKLNRETAMEIEKAGVSSAWITVDEGERTIKVMSNGMVDIKNFVDIDTEECMVYEKVRFSILKEILDKASTAGRNHADGERRGSMS